MKLNYPLVGEIAYHTYCINEFGTATFYVLWGDERGLVIDLGSGSFDARELVEKLCPKPYDVLLTHAHGDHVGAMSQWDEVWLHPADFERIQDLDRMKEMLWENPAIRMVPADGDGFMLSPSGEVWDYPYLHYAAQDIYELSEDMFMGFDKMPELLPLEEGQLFDLGGGRVCEVIHTPGHTMGSVSVLDESTRILFSGDSCNPSVGCAGASINSELCGLLKLKAKEDLYDRNFTGHSCAASSMFIMSAAPQVLDDCIWICRHILDGTADIVERTGGPMRGNAADIANAKPAYVVHGTARINFNLNRLIDEGETPAE